jgi:hypothetical protein
MTARHMSPAPPLPLICAFCPFLPVAVAPCVPGRRVFHTRRLPTRRRRPGSGPGQESRTLQGLTPQPLVLCSTFRGNEAPVVAAAAAAGHRPCTTPTMSYLGPRPSRVRALWLLSSSPPPPHPPTLQPPPQHLLTRARCFACAQSRCCEKSHGTGGRGAMCFRLPPVERAGEEAGIASKQCTRERSSGRESSKWARKQQVCAKTGRLRQVCTVAQNVHSRGPSGARHGCRHAVGMSGVSSGQRPLTLL